MIFPIFLQEKQGANLGLTGCLGWHEHPWGATPSSLRHIEHTNMYSDVKVNNKYPTIDKGNFQVAER